MTDQNNTSKILSVQEQQFEALELDMLDRHDHEREDLITGRSEEMPSHLEQRHQKEWADLQATKAIAVQR